MKPNPFPNLSSSFDRKEALELCTGFYQFFYYPDIDMDVLKDISWEDISQLYEPQSTISQALSDFPRLADVLKYMRLSHNSYLQLIKEDNGTHALNEHISFQEYDELSENAREYSKEKFENMPVFDFYSDSVSTSTAICYPLQYLNAFFYKDSFCFLDSEKLVAYNGSSLSTLKKLVNILEERRLTEFKTNLLQKNIPGSKAKYFIPKCSIISLIFVLLASNSKDIPIEFYYQILSDFVINVCVANNCKPYEILSYLSRLKCSFSPYEVVKSRRKLYSFYQEEVNQAISPKRNKEQKDKKPNHIEDKIKDGKMTDIDNINLFMDFSKDFLNLIEEYSSLQHKMSIFRQIEKDILTDVQEKSNTENPSIQSKDSVPYNYVKKEFLEHFNYKARNLGPITFDELYDFLTSESDNTRKNLRLFSELTSSYAKDFSLWKNILYTKFFFNHFK